MTDTNQEPTMEEILASIRRIISEDDAPTTDDASATPPAAVEAAPEPEPEPESETVSLSDFAPPEPPTPPATSDEVLELTDRVETMPEAPAAPPVETLGDLDVYSHSSRPEPAPEPTWNPPADNGLVSEPAARTAASAFDQLASSLIMPKDGRTLEDVVQELLRPLLKSWLDENLPRIVQSAVEAEVERIARSRVR